MTSLLPAPCPACASSDELLDELELLELLGPFPPPPPPPPPPPSPLLDLDGGFTSLPRPPCSGAWVPGELLPCCCWGGVEDGSPPMVLASILMASSIILKRLSMACHIGSSGTPRALSGCASSSSFFFFFFFFFLSEVLSSPA